MTIAVNDEWANTHLIKTLISLRISYKLTQFQQQKNNPLEKDQATLQDLAKYLQNSDVT